MNTKLFVLLMILILLSTTTFAIFVGKENDTDVPKVLSPSFVKCVEFNEKLVLLDRSSSSYNPKALVDGSLVECEQ